VREVEDSSIPPCRVKDGFENRAITGRKDWGAYRQPIVRAYVVLCGRIVLSIVLAEGVTGVIGLRIDGESHTIFPHE